MTKGAVWLPEMCIRDRQTYMTVYSRMKRKNIGQEIRIGQDWRNLSILSLPTIIHRSKKTREYTLSLIHIYLEFAEQNSFSLSLTIKAPKPVIKKGLDTSCFAVIENTLYSIQLIDTNSTEYFFYLEKIRE